MESGSPPIERPGNFKLALEDEFITAFGPPAQLASHICRHDGAVTSELQVPEAAQPDREFPAALPSAVRSSGFWLYKQPQAGD
jgi:hypothetical protein